MTEFLKRDQGLEAVKDLSSDKVIIDRKDWEECKKILAKLPSNTYKISEGYSPPPCKKLNPSLRPVQSKKSSSKPISKSKLNPNEIIWLPNNESVFKSQELGTFVPPSIDKVSGIKHDSDKPRYDLIPADALEEVAKVYAVGAKKYGDRNWELGLSYGRLFRALMSHSWAWWKGERDDKQNRLHHLTSVVFNALALLHYELNSKKYSKFDNRK